MYNTAYQTNIWGTQWSTQPLFPNTYQLITETTNSATFIEKHRIDEQNFTRNRCLTLPVLIHYYLNMVKGNAQSELNRFFQIRNQTDVPIPKVTAAAFFKARLKFSETAFIDLNTDVTNHFYDHVNTHTWNRHRVLATR